MKNAVTVEVIEAPVTGAMKTMTDKLNTINGILQIMGSCWDLPSDCNGGELFTYAEVLFDRIEAGESKDNLYSYLARIQSEKLDMPPTEAYREIADRSFELAAGSK